MSAGLSDERNAALRAQAVALDEGLHAISDALRAVALALTETNKITREAFGIAPDERH